ncbi:MAG: hypothetical protein Q7S03_00320 [bacterium]|nr:hypothetical protein [bacterium]
MKRPNLGQMLLKLVKTASLVTFMVISFCILSSSKTYAQSIKTAYPSSALQQPVLEPDNRVEKLRTFLEKRKSPLSPYSEEFIKAADEQGIDWRLVPAITGIESSFGLRMPYRSYNAYGWNNGVYKFSSWEDSIQHVSKVLRKRYIDRGATDVWKISRIYAPPSKIWAKNVNYFMAQIENTQVISLDL